MTGTVEIRSLADLPPEIADQINALADASVQLDQAAEAKTKAASAAAAARNEEKTAEEFWELAEKAYPTLLKWIIPAVDGLADEWVAKAEGRYQAMTKIAQENAPDRLQAARADLATIGDFADDWPAYQASLEDNLGHQKDLEAARQDRDQAQRSRWLINQSLEGARQQIDPDAWRAVETARQKRDQTRQATAEAEAELKDAMLRLGSADQARRQTGEELDRRVIDWLGLS